MNKRVGIGILITISLLIPTLAHADGVVIPKSIKIDKFKQDMKKHGMDLYGKDYSDGEVHNSGNSMKVVTYRPVTPEQLELIKEASVRNVRN